MNKLEDLAQKREKALLAGGEEGIRMQHKFNKMTIRERITSVLDEGSFAELGVFINGNASGVIAGYGTISSRLVYIYGNDYTFEGGMLNSKGCEKISSIMEMALKMGAPLIQIIDSTGAKLTEGFEILAKYGRIISTNAKLSGVIPQISVIAGPCTGIAAVSAAMSDFTIIAENCGEFYINPPLAIQEQEGRYISEDMYSLPEVSRGNGSIQVSVEDDRKALSMVRNLVQYLPLNNIDFSPVEANNIDSIVIDKAMEEQLISDNTDMWKVLGLIADEGSIIEINKHFGGEVITALIRINGLAVGVIANNKSISEGMLSIKSCEKITRFVKVCDSFNISIISFVDSKGFLPKVEEENNGLALSAAKMIYSLAEANVPKVALITGEAYGAAYIALASKETSFDMAFAWPSATIALSEPGKMVKALYRTDILSSENPVKTEAELLQSYLDKDVNIYKAAECGYVDDVITPSETKAKLFSALDMLQSKRLVKYPKKHGSILI